MTPPVYLRRNFGDLPHFVLNSYVEMILIHTYPCTHEITPGYEYLPIDTPIKKKPVSIPVTYPPMGISS